MSKKRTNAKKSEAKKPATVSVDKLVEENKTTGTDFQAYMRARIKNK